MMFVRSFITFVLLLCAPVSSLINFYGDEIYKIKDGEVPSLRQRDNSLPGSSSTLTGRNLGGGESSSPSLPLSEPHLPEQRPSSAAAEYVPSFLRVVPAEVDSAPRSSSELTVINNSSLVPSSSNASSFITASQSISPSALLPLSSEQMKTSLHSISDNTHSSLPSLLPVRTSDDDVVLSSFKQFPTAFEPLPISSPTSSPASTSYSSNASTHVSSAMSSSLPVSSAMSSSLPVSSSTLSPPARSISSRVASPHEEFQQHVVFTPDVVHARTRRQIKDSTWHPELQEHHHDITLGFAINGENILMDLQLNRQLLPQGYFEKQLYRNGSHSIRRPQGQDAGLCHYQGSIRGRPGSWAAVSTCHGLSGMVFDGEETHYIERVPESKPSLSSPHFLLSHKHLVPRNLTCGYNGHRHPSLELFKDDNFARMLRYKRSTGNRLEDGPASDGGGRIRGPYNSNVLSRYVELVLVADHLEYKNHGEDVQKIHKRFKDIANIANALYQPLNIFIALVGVEVWAEEDQVAISQDGDLTLTNFLNYRKVRLIPDHPNDNAQLLTGQVFDSGVVGKALKGPICTYQYSGGVNMDHSASVGLVATTVAHEMGHNFGMEHDTEEDCKCPDSRCIMAPSSGSRSPSHWSSCSHEYLALSFERSMDYCLRNKPRTLFDSPVCGNSFVEPGEQCDCGLPQHCDNPCCDPHTCQLYSNATCATGQCCDLQTCHPKEAGTECRSAHRECDLPEYCRGDSEYCPDDVFQEDGHECQAGKAFCHSGMCRSHEQQCQLLWGPTGQNSHDDCYSLNTQGNNNGNCGYNWANDTYFKCSTGNRKCGMMHCKHYNERLEFGMESVSKVSHRFIQGNEREIIPCRVAQVDLGLDMVDPGLAPDGAKCGYQKMCVNQVCMSVASLRREGCSCNGNGACNNLGHCHCALGFSPPDCLEPGFGGSIDSGPASNPHATNKFVVGLVVFFFAVVPLAVASICVVYYIRGNLGVIGLWLTKKGLPGSSRLPTRDPESGRRGGLGIPRGISSTSAGGISSSATSSSESKSNSPLLNGSANITSPHIPVVGANGTSADVKFFGKHQGFTISPIGADSLSEETASRAHTTIVVPNGLSKTSVVPPQPVRQAPSTPAKIVISNPSLQASTNRAVQPVGQVPCLPKTLPPPPSHPSSPPPVAVVNPSRRTHSAAPRPLSVPDQNSVIISRPATAPSANSSKSSSSTASKIASFLNKKDKSAEETNEDDRDANRCSTLPRKASKINRESLMQLEISAPMQLQATKLPENLVPVRVAPEPPSTVIDVTTKDGCKSPKVTWAPSVNSSEKTSAHSSDIHRIGSMREPPVTLRPSIPKFGSMRTPRPKSLPPARPSDPPPRPPLPTIPSPGSEDVYDDCVESFNNTTHITSLGEGTTSPTESIYATIEEGTSPENVTSVESKTVDSDPPSEPEPFYANSSAIIPANDQPAKKSVFSFLYGKTKRKKKESVEEPLYSNIGSIDEVNTSKDASSPPSRSSSLTPPDRASCGSSEDGGLLSEIVSELVTREPDFRNALVSRKKSKTVDDKCGAFIQDKNTVSLTSNKSDPLVDSTPLPIVDTTSSNQVSRSRGYPWRSHSNEKPQALGSSHSNENDSPKILTKAGGVLSYLKRSIPDDKDNTIVVNTGEMNEMASPDLKSPITAVSNTTITTQIMSGGSVVPTAKGLPANQRLESSLAAVRAASKQLNVGNRAVVEQSSTETGIPLSSNFSGKKPGITTPKPTVELSDPLLSPVKSVLKEASAAGEKTPDIPGSKVGDKPSDPSINHVLSSQSSEPGDTPDKSLSSTENTNNFTSNSNIPSTSVRVKVQRPEFPPDKVLFPPDKLDTKASKSEAGAISPNSSVIKVGGRNSSASKGKNTTARNKFTAVSPPKTNEASSKPSRVLSPTRSSGGKGPVSIEKGNLASNSKNSGSRTKFTASSAETSDTKEGKKPSLSSSSTSAARSSARRPAVRNNTAYGGKSVGSSNVASLQQKFEKEVAGTPPAQESKTTVPARVSSARRTSDTKPSITPKPRT